MITKSQPHPTAPPGPDPRRRDPLSRLWVLWAVIGLAVLGLLVARGLNLFGEPAQRVVAYCAQDQEYAEPFFQDFKNQTGILVQPVFDNEAVKSTGLANRLLAESSHPQCDVFWGNEEMRTRQLAAAGAFRPQNGWAAFGYRSRRVVINTNLLSFSNAPRSLLELTNSVWQGRVALAYPQFGTTGAHFHALRQLWGEVVWLDWCRGLVANKSFLVDGNSVVVKKVGSGDAAIGLTDSDDIAAGQREGLPVAALPMNSETLLIPNTVAVTRDAPHPATAQILFEGLQEPEVIERLVAAGALEGASPEDVETKTLQVNWDALLRDLEPVTAELNKIFLR